MAKISAKTVRIAGVCWAVVSVGLFVLSVASIRNSGESVTWIYWAYPLGAFVWEDLISISLYNLLVAAIVAVRKQYRIALLGFLLFWLVRASGETFYWFLQQFSQNLSYPHTDYPWNRGGLFTLLFPGSSDQKWFILHQVNWQVMTVLCLLGLFLLLKNWKKLKSD